MLCGGAGPGKDQGRSILRLNLHGPSPNVRLQIEDISRRLVANIPDELVDLLEIASLRLCGGQRDVARRNDRRSDGRALAAQTSVRDPGPRARISGRRTPIVVGARRDAELPLRRRLPSSSSSRIRNARRCEATSISPEAETQLLARRGDSVLRRPGFLRRHGRGARRRTASASRWLATVRRAKSPGRRSYLVDQLRGRLRSEPGLSRSSLGQSRRGLGP